MRRPQDKLGQRILLYELRHAIDRARRQAHDDGRLRELLTENPRTSRNTYVTYNLGVMRREWLAEWERAHARSLADSTRPTLVGGAAAQD